MEFASTGGWLETRRFPWGQRQRDLSDEATPQSCFRACLICRCIRGIPRSWGLVGCDVLLKVNCDEVGGRGGDTLGWVEQTSRGLPQML
jgi:hypothetical protein